MKQVQACRDLNRLCEVMQNNKTQFALSRYDGTIDTVIQCHQFVHCRDFMLDALAGVEDSANMQVYGFRYTTDNPRPDTQNTSLLLKFPDEGTLKNFNENLQILISLEGYLGWVPTFADVVEYSVDKCPVVWVLGDRKWQSTAVSFSLYTYLLKCLTYPIKDKNHWKEAIKTNLGVESSYMDIPHINFLLNNLNEINAQFKNFTGWKDQKARGSGIHHNSGFVSSKYAFEGRMGYEKHALFNYGKSTKKVAVAA